MDNGPSPIRRVGDGHVFDTKLAMSRLFYISLSLLSFAAGFALWYVTPAGLGLTNDSAAYIGGARSLLAGTGYSDVWLDSDLEAVTHYPPLLSLTLSGIGLLGLDPYRGARVLNILLFAANTGLIGLLGFRATKSQAAGIFLALLFATNAQLLRIHAQVLSEPLFIFLSLASFLTFSFALEYQPTLKTDNDKNRPSTSGYALRSGTGTWLLLTGLLTSLAFLARYSGLALIAAFLLATFLLSQHSRLKRIALFLAGAIPPIAIWFIRNSLVADSATNRVIQFNPIQISNIRTGLWNVADFLTPAQGLQAWMFGSGALSYLLALVGLLLLAWLGYQAWFLLFHKSQNRPIHQSPNPLAFTTAIYVFGYLGAVLFSMSFFDASTKFQHRILSPLYVSWMILLVAILKSINTKDTKGTKEKSVFFRVFREIRVLVLVLSLLILVLSTFNFQRSLTELREIDGLGYASWRWRQMNVLAIIKDLPPEVAIYSNSPPAVYLVTGRASRVIPTTINPVSGLPRTGYEQSLAEMREELLVGRAVLALFDTSDIEGAFGEEIALQFDGLTLLEKSQGNVLYGKP
jgi:4-amino-4-deoxy-L-arabinose transferase-like glycosyltransferase